MTPWVFRGGRVSRHPLLAMYVVLFALAWAVLVPQALAPRGVLPFRCPPTPTNCH